MYIRVALYNAINSKRKTYYTIQRLHQSSNILLLLARFIPLSKSDFGLLYPEKVVGVRGEFDNSVSDTTKHLEVQKSQFGILEFSESTYRNISINKKYAYEIIIHNV
jgi:hypothetical protein